MHNKIHAWLQSERERWILWLPVGLGLGAGGYFLLPTEPVITAPVLAVLSGLILLATGRFHILLKAAGIIWLTLAIGFTAGWIKSHALEAPVLTRQLRYAEVQGTVAETISEEKGAKFILQNVTIEKLSPEQTPPRISVNSRQPQNEIEPGDRITIKAGLFPPPEAAFPGAYDFRRHFFFENIGAVGYIASNEITIRQKSAGNTWRQWWSAVRRKLTEHIQNTMTPPNGAIAAALITGDDRAIPEEVKENMRASGLYHILAVSGMNLALVAGILFFTVRYLLVLIPGLAIRAHVKKWAALLALIGTIGYLFLAGSPVSAQRACVMMGLILFAVMLDRQVTPMRSLAWAAAILLLFEPESVLAPGFQLSFAATLALIGFFEAFKDPFKHWSSIANWWQKGFLYIASVSLSTLVAGTATAPFAIYHFNRFTSYSLLANMLVIPIVSFWLMPLAMLALLLMPFGLDRFVFKAMEWGIIFMCDVAQYAAHLPQATWHVSPPTWWGMVIISLAGLWLCLWQRPLRLAGIPLMIGGMLTLFLTHYPDIWVNRDSNMIAVKDANNQLVLVQGGGRNFLAKQWLESVGQEVFLKPDEAVWNKNISLQCDPQGCIYTRNGTETGILKTADAVMEDCATSNLIITMAGVRDDVCNTTPIINDYALYKFGTHVVWIQNGKWQIKTVRERHKRLWNK